MKAKHLLACALLSCTTGCFVAAGNDQAAAVATGTLRVDWTIDGADDPHQCQQSSVASLDVVVTAADGSDAGEYKESCSAMATRIDLPPGRYTANAVLLDSSGGERTTEISIARFAISSDTETAIPVDFPADSFH